MTFIAGLKSDVWGARSFDAVHKCWHYLLTVLIDVTEDKSLSTYYGMINPDMDDEPQALIELFNNHMDDGSISDWFWCAEQ